MNPTSKSLTLQMYRSGGAFIWGGCNGEGSSTAMLIQGAGGGSSNGGSNCDSSVETVVFNDSPQQQHKVARWP